LKSIVKEHLFGFVQDFSQQLRIRRLIALFGTRQHFAQFLSAESSFVQQSIMPDADAQVEIMRIITVKSVMEDDKAI
jgi:hypothetical protein